MALDKVRDILGSIIRIQIKDGRIIEGEFQCMDRELNIVLAGATEYHNLQEVDFTDPPDICRRLGMAMIPGHHIIRCCLLSSDSKDCNTSKISAVATYAQLLHPLLLVVDVKGIKICLVRQREKNSTFLTVVKR
eukprot:gene3457-6883_t